MKTKPKRQKSIWNGAPYGTYDGSSGHAEQWRAAYEETMSGEKAIAIVADDSPWEILGVPTGSALPVVRAAFGKLMLEHHPDHGGDKEVCQRIIAAWTLFKDKLV